jgi:hypothetical protein
MQNVFCAEFERQIARQVALTRFEEVATAADTRWFAARTLFCATGAGKSLHFVLRSTTNLVVPAGASDPDNLIEIVVPSIAVRSSWLPISEAICIALNKRGYDLGLRESRVGRMLIRKLLQTRKADAELPKEIRAALIESLCLRRSRR